MNIEVAGDGGSTTSEATWYKNQDEFQISTNPAYIINKSWQVGSIIKFRSQFANGYVSRSQQTADDRKSTFMSPGYLDISGGFTYTCPLERFPIKINLSPIALSAVFVESAKVRSNRWDDKPGWQAYGLSNANKTSKYEGGSSIQIDFDRTFGKKGIFRYRTTLFSFMGWMSNLNMKNRYTSVSAYEKALQAWMMHRESAINRCCKSIRRYAGKIPSTSRQQNTFPRRSISSSTTTGRKTTTSRPSCC